MAHCEGRLAEGDGEEMSMAGLRLRVVLVRALGPVMTISDLSQF